METVNFNCSHCGKLMAVTTEHLGSQVHCPHCEGIVQAPPRPSAVAAPERKTEEASATAPAGAAAEASRDIQTSQTAADIFSDAEENAGSNFASAREGPRPATDSADRVKGDSHDGNLDFAAKKPDEHWLDSKSTESADAQEFKAAAPRYRKENSMFVPILLMFLIPYSLVTTGYIAWMLLNRQKAFDPLELLRDPKKEDGGPKRVKPTSKLPDHLKTALNKPIQIQDVEVTPLKVEFFNNEMKLSMKMRNVSSDIAFNPLPDSFVNMKLYSDDKRPYTYLDPGAENLNCYGGTVAWQKGEQAVDGVLGPGEEMTVHLFTASRDKEKVRDVMKSAQAFTWRVQVRRGFVHNGQEEVSATAVVGVEFPISAVAKTE